MDGRMGGCACLLGHETRVDDQKARRLQDESFPCTIEGTMCNVGSYFMQLSLLFVDVFIDRDVSNYF